MKAANPILRTTATSILALTLALGTTVPAFAAITNTAQISGSTPSGGTVTDTSSESVTVETAVPEFTIVKSIASISTAAGDIATDPDGGDTIVFQYAVANTGNITLDGSTVSITDPGPQFGGTDPDAPLGAISYLSGDTNTNGNIEPSETWIFQASYVMTQGDVNHAVAGGATDNVTNTVTTASVDDSGGNPATFDTVGSTLTATGTIPENASISLTKIATRDGTHEDDGSGTAYAVGEDIVYLFTVTNDGNVTVSGITVSETAFTAPSKASAPTITCTASGNATINALSPGETTYCSATYTVQEADM